MKKITFILCSLFVGVSYSQTFPLDFSDPADVFTGVNGSSANIVVNPAGCAPDGCTGDVLEINGAGDQFGDPVSLDLLNYVDLTDTNNNTITLDFYAGRVGNLLVQMANPSDNGLAVEVLAPVTVGLNSLSLDFDTADNAFPNCQSCPTPLPIVLDKYGSILLFVDFGDAGVVETHWVDNIDGGLDGGPVASLPAPTDAPPTPPARPAADVISIYGEAYGPAIGLNNVPWDAPTDFVEENIAGNNVLKIDFGVFMGSSLGSVVDATAMTHFHMDFWIANDFTPGQVFNTKWSNHAGGAGETDAGELVIVINPGDVQTWISVDVPLTQFNNVNGGGIDNRADLTEFLITAAGFTSRAYIDNVYFHKNTTLSVGDFDQVEFKVFPNPSSSVWNFESNSIIETVEIFSLTGKKILSQRADSQSISFNVDQFSTGIYLARVAFDNGQTKTMKLIKE